MAQFSGTPAVIPAAFLTRVVQSARYAITGIMPNTWMSPLQPLAPMAPPEVKGRQFDYQVGLNTRYIPRSTELVGFAKLRALAENCGILRTVIERQKDLIEAFEWQIKPREETPGKRPAETKYKGEIEKITAFMRKPDQAFDWSQWLRAVLEDLFVIDAVTLYRRPTFDGSGLWGLERIAGDTITVLVDAGGRTPQAPSPAYQQCYSDDTQVLTRAGWKRFADVDIEVDEVATRNVTTHAFEWQRPTDKTERPYVGPMLRFSSRMLDVCVTPEHRMLVDRLPHALGGHAHRKRGDAFITAQQLADHGTSSTMIPLTWTGVEIGEKTFALPSSREHWEGIERQAVALRAEGLSYSQIAARLGIALATAHRACTHYTKAERKTPPADGKPLVMTGDEYCAFMGAYLAEGCTNGNSVLISQTAKGAGINAYSEFFAGAFAGRGAHYLAPNFYINSKALAEHLKPFGLARQKFVPDEIMNAPPRQLEIFWRYFHFGDGDRSRERIFTSSERLADQMVEIAQKMGKTAYCVKSRRAVRHIVEGNTVRTLPETTMYTVSVRQNAAASVVKTEKMHYAGNVWCLSVPNTTLYVRRNGQPAWCGNCLKGIPASDFTTEELIYYPRSPRNNRLYGNPPVQQIIREVETAIERVRSQKAFFSEGNLVDGMFSGPKEWSIDQIKAWQSYWDDQFLGNVENRRHGIWVPNGTTFEAIKPPPLKDDFDEWLARIICFAFSTSPQPFIKQVSRGNQESQQQVAEDGGIASYMQFIKRLVDKVIAEDFNAPQLEFSWSTDKEFDPLIQAQINDIGLKNGSKVLNEVRDQAGDDPYPPEIGDVPLVITATGGVTVESIITPPAPPEPVSAPAPGGEGAPPASSGGVAAGGVVAPKPKEPAAPLKKAETPAPGVDTPRMRKARAATKKAVHKVFTAMARDVSEQVRRKALMMGKADASDPEKEADAIAASLGLSALDDIAEGIEDTLAEVAEAGGNLTMLQVGLEDDDKLTGQVAQRALTWARDRSAELVGKRWTDDGELIDNPNAKWAIDDSTRTMLRNTIADALADNKSVPQIADTIAALKDAVTGSYAFSEQRAEVIAFNEVTRANVQGSLAGAREAQDAGVVLKKLWLGGQSPCGEICQPNIDQGAIDLADDFESGDDGPPGHPGCYCSVSFEVDLDASKADGVRRFFCEAA